MKRKIKNVLINYEIIGEGIPIIMLHGYCVDHGYGLSFDADKWNILENFLRVKEQ